MSPDWFCKECEGLLPHHGGSPRQLVNFGTYYMCIWCGTRLKSSWKNLIMHPQKCTRNPKKQLGFCEDPCSECSKKEAWYHGKKRIYKTCRHGYCKDCDPGIEKNK